MYIFQESDTYGVIEVGLWILRVFIALCGMISTQSLYRYLFTSLLDNAPKKVYGCIIQKRMNSFCFVYSYLFIYFSFLFFSKWRDQKTVLKSLQSLNVVSEKTLLLYVREVRYKVHTYLPSVCNFFTRT